MEWKLLADNLTNPSLLFFCLGLFAVQLKSDLEIPSNSSKFITLYLLFSIGFRGGQELSHSEIEAEVIWTIITAVSLSLLIPILAFFLVKNKLGVENAGAIAAAYGSVSAVTFITAVSFLEAHSIHFGGHMVAVMALMEAPAIIAGVLLISLYRKTTTKKSNLAALVKHAFTNGSVLMILGSLVIGYIASDSQAEGIAPFTTDLFKGFLSIFLLDMGITSGRKLKTFWDNGWFSFGFAILTPLCIGSLVAAASLWVSPQDGNRLLLTVLAASASYIAVPAAMKLAAPKANPGLYVPMALAITFPMNIIFGIPWYLYIIHQFPL
ncbi:MAG: sodium-dependent bicarbonate transport family permease [Flavobacteriaceae bacterium]